MESLCSVTSDVEAPITRTTRRRRLPPTVSQENEISDVESCSSAVSASNTGPNTRRKTRRNAIVESSDPALVELSMAKAEMVQEAESCSSVVSETQRVTRSQRKTTRTRSLAKQQIEDSEFSDTDSHLSSISGADVSTTRRNTRSRRQTGPIPLQLDESSLSPALPRRSSRAARGKVAVTADLSEPQSCDSEGFESGPVCSARKQRRRKASALDSDSELTDVHSPVGSPCSTRSRETPCSSRTGSGSSSHRAPASWRSARQLCIVIEKDALPAGEEISLNDSRLESTVIAEDADCTLLEEEESQTTEEKVAVSPADDNSNEVDVIEMKRGVKVTEEHTDVSHSSLSAEVVGEPAVVVKDQQGEPYVKNKEGDSSEMEDMQETASASERGSACEKTSETIEETEDRDRDMEVVVVDTCPSQRGEDEDAVVKIQPGEEEKMDATSLNADSLQVVDSSEVVSIHLASSQKHNITVAADAEQQPEDTVIVQNRKTVSLLESSEDDDDEEEEDERDISDEEHMEEDRGRPSRDSEAAGTSLDGLFMIDTRPGQEADEQFYLEKPTKKEERVELEEEEEFVDEEGEDDEEDSNILFSSRNPLL